jgi:hypothetical protein
MNDSRVQGRTDFTPAVTPRLVIQQFQLMCMLVEGPCQFQGHPSWVSVEQRPTTYGGYSDECQAAQQQPAVMVRHDLNAL